MHLNGFVDFISKAFLDVVIQPSQQPDERQAFHTMLDHFQPDVPEKYIVTADRGYESYDLLFHCELKHLKYVFRVKAPSSSRSLLSSYIWLLGMPFLQLFYHKTIITSIFQWSNKKSNIWLNGIVINFNLIKSVLRNLYNQIHQSIVFQIILYILQKFLENSAL